MANMTPNRTISLYFTASFFILCWTIVLCLHYAHGSVPYTDSMVYDDIIRDVPRMLRRAQDRSSVIKEYSKHMHSLSVTHHIEKLLKEYKEGDDSFLSSMFHPTNSSVNTMTLSKAKTAATTDPRTTLTPALSTQCGIHVAAFFDGILSGEEWALRMIDAYGKVQAGLLEAHIRAYGDYYECKKSKGTQLSNGRNVTVRGKYCLSTLSVFEDGTESIDISAQEGLCVPNVCSQDEVHILLDEVLQKYNASDTFVRKAVVCHFDQSPDGVAIFAIVFIVFLGLIALIATVVDIRYPMTKSLTKAEEEKEEIGEADGNVERNGRASINTNENYSHNHHNHNHHLIATPDYQNLLTPKRTVNNRIREKLSVQVLLCFSIKANFKNLMDTGGKEDAMTCIHGLRFVTISWIIVGHTVLLVAKRAENFVSYGKMTIPYIFYQLFFNATFACDSFLCFSGILVCYNLMHTLEYFKGKMRWHLFYIYRYMRLTPAMALVMLIYSTTFQYWDDGPIWPQGGLEPQRCRGTWWHNLLYINNFFHNQCMGWLWYLAVDTQLYAISPIYAVLLYKKPRLGIYFIVVTTIASLGITSYIAYAINLTPSSFAVLANGQSKGDIMVEYYYATYCRLSPYMIGMLTGYLLYVKDRKMNIPRIWQAVGWSVVVPSSILIVFGLYKATMYQTDQVPLTLTQSVIYNTLSRPAWGFIVSWVIVICVTGHGGILNKVLSWKPLIPFARATYMAYMIHIVIILWYVLSIQRSIYMTDPLMFVLFFGFIFMTYLLAFPATLLFEAPIMSLQRLLKNRHEKKKKEVVTFSESDQGDG